LLVRLAARGAKLMHFLENARSFLPDDENISQTPCTASMRSLAK
jgi:hypothetical protein